MTSELSDIIDNESERTTIKEKIGLGLTYLSSLPVIPYIYNRLIARSLESQEILTPLANSAGNVPHILMAYYGGKFLESVFNNEKITNAVVGIATAYHVAGEIFHSEIAPNLPQILPGTPDIKDVPLTLAIGAGLYLANKKI